MTQKRKRIDVCVQCGRPDEAHRSVSNVCPFIPVMMPESCICPVAVAWGYLDPVPDVCCEFQSDEGAPDMCLRCKHYRGCHR